MSVEDNKYTLIYKNHKAVLRDERDVITDGFHTFGELYRERSALTAALARMALEQNEYGFNDCDAWIDRDNNGQLGFCTVLYVLLPTGQVSWHFSDADAADLLKWIPKRRPAKSRQYDGHSTQEKFARVESFARHEDE